jgi:hypothetical protein
MADKVIMTCDGKVALDDLDKIMVRKQSIGDIALTSTGDMYTYRDEIRCYRPFWCWRVRGWGPNTSNVPGYCTYGGLGDADQDYTDTICFDFINPVDADPEDGVHARWGLEIGAGGIAFDFIDHFFPSPNIVMTFVFDDDAGFSDSAVKVSSLNESTFKITYPTTIAAVFGGPFCDLVVDPNTAEDTPPQDPDNPSEWAPWCRSQNGLDMSVDLW